DIGDATVNVTRISFQSPLVIDLLFKKLPGALGSGVAKTLRLLLNRVLFHDVERALREAQVAGAREDVIAKRLANISAALDVAKRIPDKELRKQFVRSLQSSLMPFHTEHPP